jgi:hypothetical protein
MFEILMYIQIVLLIVAAGANATYALWLQRGMANREALPFALEGVQSLDNQMARPAYVLLLITGIGLYLTAEDSQSAWTLLAVILWLVVLVIGFAGYSPTLRKQISLAGSAGADSSEYKSVAWRGTFLGILGGVIVLVILYLMVFQPALWG